MRPAAVFRMLLLWLVVLMMTGCSSTAHHSPAPVKKGQPSAAAHGGTHRVDYGETLISIAWLYGLDHEVLAELNQLKPPYEVQPGQRLMVDPKQAKRSAIAATKPSIQPLYLPKQKPGAWVWPAKGPVLATFSEGGSKGIDIGGKAGDPILAAQDGVVVYAGQHLRGYGKVILIQHEKGLVSAYAHNQDNYVSVGQTVRQSQRIASMGKTDAHQVKLHFEIRQHGKPVDPLHFF